MGNEGGVFAGVAEADGLGGACSGAACAAGASEALAPDFFEARRAELQKRVSPKRYAHVMGVVETCERLARTYGIDVASARLAGLLHDWDKDYDDPAIRKRALDLGVDVNPWIVEHQPRLLHGPTAACALGREFPAIPHEVLQAIACHTTGTDHMSPLDKVLYVADALEPNRRFGKVGELRDLVGQVSLDELFVRVLGYWTILIIEQGKTLHPDTVKVWNAYAMKNDKPYVKADRKERL